MAFVGRIEAKPETPRIDAEVWRAAVDSHASLSKLVVEPSMGINPFTRQKQVFKAKADDSTAIMREGASRVGTIFWALDGSPFLVVESEDEHEETAEKIAISVANMLGARFVKEL